MGKLIEDLVLTDIHSGGKAIGRHNGKNIFVPFGVPGDIVDVELDRRQQGFYSGTIVRLKQPSFNRVEPFCKHHTTCGGCNWQHIDYATQLELKKHILENALTKYEIKTPPIPSVIPSSKTAFYRNKVEYAFASEGVDVEGYLNNRPSLGFHAINNRTQVIDIDECWLQREPSRAICEKVKQIAIQQGISFYNYENRIGLLRNMVIRTSTTGQTLVIIGFTADDREITIPFLEQLKKEIPQATSLLYCILTSSEKGFLDGKIELYSGDGYLTECMVDLRFRVSPKAFYQPNADQALKIYEKVLEYAAPRGNEFVYDLYTGAGTIACYIAPNVRKVFGIEGSIEAIEDAKVNAQINSLSNAEFMVGDILKTFTPEFVTDNENPDIVILDPPRSGTLIEIKRTITNSAPAKIIYVSCNPVSLAFDLKMLTDRYHVKQIQPYDMFPHTHHVETVVLLEKE